MPDVNGMLESALYVKDVSKACAFYGGVLGLRRFNESEVHCAFQVAKHILLIISEDKARVPSVTDGGVIPPALSVRARLAELDTSRLAWERPSWIGGELT